MDANPPAPPDGEISRAAGSGGKWRWTLAIAAVVSVFALSSIPIDRWPPVHGLDKAFHLIEFLVVGLVVLNLLTQGFRRFHWARLSLAALILLGIAGLDELYQFWIPGRRPDRLDLLYSSLGAGLAILVSLGIRVAQPLLSRENARG